VAQEGVDASACDEGVGYGVEGNGKGRFKEVVKGKQRVEDAAERVGEERLACASEEVPKGHKTVGSEFTLDILRHSPDERKGVAHGWGFVGEEGVCKKEDGGE
jgi:hypothetical protein